MDYDFISPKEFEEIIKSGKVKGKKILLTFDDGFKSNRFITESFLNKKGIKAIYFIISDFIGLKHKSNNYNQIIKNIYPLGCNYDQLSEPMNSDDIRYLINTGHTIGCHTASHKMISKITSKTELNKELIESKKNLENTYNIIVDHIAYPFGTYESINRKALELLSDEYKFIHSGLRGNNISVNKLLYRDATNPEMNINRLKAFLFGNVDLIYKKKYKLLKSFIIDTV